MAKIKTLHNGHLLIIDQFTDNVLIPKSEEYRISTFNDDHHYHDELTLTRDQWNELETFIRNENDDTIYEPFGDKEIRDEFQPRFGGANPKYVDYYRAGWTAAFEYVNDVLRKKIWKENK